MKKLILLFLLNTLFQLVQAQDPLLVKAERYYSFQKFDLSLRYYLKYYSKAPDSLDFELNKRIGNLYLNTNIDKSQALIYLLRAKLKNPKASRELAFPLAKAYYYDYKFESAIQLLSEYSLESESLEEKQKAGDFLQKILSADAIYNTPVDANVIYLGDTLNSTKADFNAFINEDETRLYFSSRREKNMSNIFFSDYDTINGKWKKPNKIKEVSSFYEDILAGIKQDGSQLFIHYLDDSPNVDLVSSKISNNVYSEPNVAGKLISSVNKEEGAFLCESGDTLYFASAREGGYGGLDIYYSLLLPDGQWGIPINMGDKINSSKDENYPFLSPDGNKIYFSSKGYNNMGGYDIFTSVKDSLGEWSYPSNLGYPVNDLYDNTCISFPKNSRYAYASYVKPYIGAGSYDIYKIIFKERTPGFLTFIGFVYYGTNNDKKLVTLLDTDMSINIYQRKSDELVGTYSINQRTAKLVISLLPGDYTIIIESASYQTYKENIKVKEETLRQDILFKDFILKPKS